MGPPFLAVATFQVMTATGGLRKETGWSCLFSWKPGSHLVQTALPTFPAALLCDFERGSPVTDSSLAPAEPSSQLWEGGTLAERSGSQRQPAQTSTAGSGLQFFEVSRIRNQITIIVCCWKLKERGFRTSSVTMRQASHKIVDPGDNECKFSGGCLLLLWGLLSG